MPEKTLSSLVVKASCALARARPTSSQTLDEWESALFFPLSATRYFFRRRVIFSVEVARDAVFVVSVSGVVGVTETPFSTTRTVCREGKIPDLSQADTSYYQVHKIQPITKHHILLLGFAITTQKPTEICQVSCKNQSHLSTCKQ